jgi:hypothetical protein
LEEENETTSFFAKGKKKKMRGLSQIYCIRKAFLLAILAHYCNLSYLESEDL